MNGLRDQIDFFDGREGGRFAEFEALDIEWYRREISTDRKLHDMDRFGKEEGLTRKFWWERTLGKLEGRSILDVGCGVSYHLFYWALAGNWVLGLDPSVRSLEIDRMLARRLGTEVRLVVGTGENPPLREKFDVIHMNNTLHHVESPLDTLAEARSLCKDEGVLVLVEPNYHYPPRWIVHTNFLARFNPFKRYFIRKKIMPEFDTSYPYRFTLGTIARSGFRVETIEYDSNYLGYAFYFVLGRDSLVGKLLHLLDERLLRHVLPRALSPFLYVIARPA